MNYFHVKSLCKATSTNNDAVPLFMALCENSASDKNEIDFKDIDFVSSSFLNSSIGLFIENYGLDTFKSTMKCTNCSPAVAKMIRKYVKNSESFAVPA